jgi:hypothetical protein
MWFAGLRFAEMRNVLQERDRCHAGSATHLVRLGEEHGAAVSAARPKANQLRTRLRGWRLESREPEIVNGGGTPRPSPRQSSKLEPQHVARADFVAANMQEQKCYNLGSIIGLSSAPRAK